VGVFRRLVSAEPAEVEQTSKTIAAEIDRELPASLSELADRLASLNVQADRWSSPDLLAQLRAQTSRPIDTVLCNLLDENSEAPLQAHVAAEFAPDLVGGLEALAKFSGASRVLAAIGHDCPPEQARKIRDAFVGTRIVPIVLRSDYPQPNPILLIHQLTRRHVRWGQPPTDQGIILLDAAAAVAVGQAINLAKPMAYVPLAIHDYTRRATHYAIAPMGMRWRELLEAFEISTDMAELRAGSPLRQIRLGIDDKITGGELMLSASWPEPRVVPDPCIRCSWCVEGCPVRIRPEALLDAAQQEDLYTAARLGLDACIECGICSYVCPSRLPLMQSIRHMRAQK
jgi:electron transport complex protein RnfC